MYVGSCCLPCQVLYCKIRPEAPNGRYGEEYRWRKPRPNQYRRRWCRDMESDQMHGMFPLCIFESAKARVASFKEALYALY